MHATRAVLFLVALAAVAAGQPQPVPTKPASPVPEGKAPAPDKLPEGVRLRLGSNKFREPNYINAVSLSPDGKLLAVCGGQQTIRFLDVATGTEVRRIGIREYLRTNQIFWSADGKQLITTGYNGINVWDANDGKLIKQATSPNRDGRDGMIHVSDDGKSAAVGTQYQEGSVKVIDLANGNQVSTVKPAQNGGVQGTLSPKGETLATWGQHYNRGNGKAEDEQVIARSIQLWDAREGKEKRTLVSDIYQIQSVKFSPDGAKLAAGGNGVIQMWDVGTGKVERRFAGRMGQGTQIVFSRDGKTLSAAGTDGCVQSWDIATGKRAGICEGPATAVAGLQYRPDGQLLAWAINANAIDLWEVPSGKRLTPQGGHTAPVSALLFSPDGKTLTSCGNEGRILRWDVATGKELAPFELKESEAKRRMYGYPRQVGPSYFSPNGKYLIGAGTNGGVASVWDVDAGLELFALTNAGGYVDRGGIIAFSGDSTKLIAMNRYGGRDAAVPIPIWDLETGLPLPPLKGQKGDMMGAAFSTDGRTLATSTFTYHPQGQSTEIWSWDLATGKTLSKVVFPNFQVQGLQFLDQRLYVPFPMGGPGPFKVYDALTGKEVRALESPKNQNATGTQSMTLSPDRRLMAWSPQAAYYTNRDGTMRQSPQKVIVWEVASGSIRHELDGPVGALTALAFSRDGKTLAGGSMDTTIYLWDLHKTPGKVEPLSAARLDDLWKALDGPDARKAEEAMQTLAARPAEAVPFLQAHLKPVAGDTTDPAKIRKMIADLDSGRFAVREAAMRDLERLGRVALEPVQEALKSPAITPEVRERLEKLADTVNQPDADAAWIRPLRAVEALERIATPEAAAHLKALAAGGDAPPTRAAKDAVGRLDAK
jgi:WD40 repeat protein